MGSRLLAPNPRVTVLFLLFLLFPMGEVQADKLANFFILWPPSQKTVLKGVKEDEWHPFTGDLRPAKRNMDGVEVWVHRSRESRGSPAQRAGKKIRLIHFVEMDGSARGYSNREFMKYFPEDVDIELWAVNPPGYGGSSGKLRMEDFAKAAEVVYSRMTAEAEQDPSPIFATGSSLGTMTALKLASDHPELSGVIVRDPVPLKELIEENYCYPGLGWLAKRVASSVPEELDSLANAEKLQVPLIILTSGKDTMVPPKLQDRIAKCYHGQRLTQIVLPELGHIHPIRDVEEIQREIQSILSPKKKCAELEGKSNLYLESKSEGKLDREVDEPRGTSPAHIAVFFGRQEQLESLIRAGAPLSKKDARGYTPTHYAVATRRTELLKRLLAQKVDLETRSDAGKTPLHDALLDPVIFKMLLDHGAKLEAEDTASQNDVVASALEGKHAEVLKVITDHLFKQGKSLLHWAAENKRDKTLLQMATTERQLERAGLLAIPKKAKRISGHDWSSKPGIFSFLINRNMIDLNRRDEMGLTVLQKVVSESPQLAQILLDAGAKLSLSDLNEVPGSHPVLTAADKGNGTILMEYSKVAAQEGKTLVQWLSEQNQVEALEHLAAYNRKWGGTLRISIKNKYGETPLMLEAMRGRGMASEVLLSLGNGSGGILEADELDSQGRSPMHLAALHGHPHMIRVFAPMNSEPFFSLDAQDNQGNTPLHLAAERGHWDVVEMLIVSKAKKTIKNGRGETPFQVAKRIGNKKVLETFKRLGVRR